MKRHTTLLIPAAVSLGVLLTTTATGSTSAVPDTNAGTAVATSAPPAPTPSSAAATPTTSVSGAQLAAQYIVGGAGYDLCPLLDNEKGRALLGTTAKPPEVRQQPLYELASAMGLPSDGQPPIEGSVDCTVTAGIERMSLMAVTDDQLKLSGSGTTVADSWSTRFGTWGDPFPGIGDAAVFSASPDYLEITARAGGIVVDGFIRKRSIDLTAAKAAMTALIKDAFTAIAGAKGGTPVTMPAWKPASSPLANGTNLCDIPLDLIAKASRVAADKIDPVVAVRSSAHPKVEAACMWTRTFDSGRNLYESDQGPLLVAVHQAASPREAGPFSDMVDLNAPPTPGLGDGSWMDATMSALLVKKGDRLLEISRLDEHIKSAVHDDLTPIAQLLLPKL